MEAVIVPIKITIGGGLGNQLFQICAGLYIEKSLHREVNFDISNFQFAPKNEKGNYVRALGVSELVEKDKLLTKKYPLHVDTITRFLTRKLNPNSILVENGPNDEVLNRIDSKTVSIYGYFQRFSLVEQVWPELRERMLRSDSFGQLINSSVRKKIAMHLRFGDYSDDPKTRSVHGLTDANYYLESLNVFKKDFVEQIPVSVVTDDLMKAKKLVYGFDKNFKFKFFSSNDPIVDLREISTSTHICISNSTFSWWGAWIGSKEFGSKVIYPSPWFANNSETDLPIFVPYWQQRSRKFIK